MIKKNISNYKVIMYDEEWRYFNNMTLIFFHGSNLSPSSFRD